MTRDELLSKDLNALRKVLSRLTNTGWMITGRIELEVDGEEFAIEFEKTDWVIKREPSVFS